MNRRRKLLVVLGAGALTAPLLSVAQRPGKIWRIGFLSQYSSDLDKIRLGAFRQGLRDLGYVEGKTIIIEERHADGRLERLGALAAELARLPLDVLVAHGGSGGAHARKATTSIPIVFIAHPDPVGLGTVASLSRPGGNVTGLSDLHGDLVAKRLELLKETVPSVSRVAALWSPDNLAHKRQLLNPA